MIVLAREFALIITNATSFALNSEVLIKYEYLSSIGVKLGLLNILN